MTRTRLRRGLAALALIATLTLGSAACGKNSSTGMPGMDHGSAMPSSPSMGGMPGMDADEMPGKQTPLVLSDTVTVPGQAADAQLPPPATSTQVDGYTLTLGGDGLTANMSHIMTVTVSRDGNPVTDLQPYLATYAHLTAFHSGDLAFAHLHPHGTPGGDHGGPALTFTAMLPRPGNWRLFLQFQTAGVLHTAALTVNVG